MVPDEDQEDKPFLNPAGFSLAYSFLETLYLSTFIFKINTLTQNMLLI